VVGNTRDGLVTYIHIRRDNVLHILVTGTNRYIYMYNNLSSLVHFFSLSLILLLGNCTGVYSAQRDLHSPSLYCLPIDQSINKLLRRQIAVNNGKMNGMPLLRTCNSSACLFLTSLSHFFPPLVENFTHGIVIINKRPHSFSTINYFKTSAKKWVVQ
jgi:hypothetical protein